MNYMYQSACGGFVSEFVAGQWEGYPEALCKNTVIRGNVVEKSAVIHLKKSEWIIGTPDTWDQTYVITFSGNTYVQNDNRFIMTGGEGQRLMPDILTAEAIKADLEFFLGDKDAVIFETSVAY